MIYEARVKDERQKVGNLRNMRPDGIKKWYNFIQGNNRSNEVQIHELVVDGCKVSDHGQMVKPVVDFWEDIGGMNEPLIDEEPVTLQIEEYDLKIDDKITCEEIETFLKTVKNGKASGPDEIPFEFYKYSVYRLGNLVTGHLRSVWGVRQGCTLSPLLFGLYTEQLAVRLRMRGFGLKVGEEKLSCLLYADDIVVSETSSSSDLVAATVVEWSATRVLYRVSASCRKTAGSNPAKDTSYSSYAAPCTQPAKYSTPMKTPINLLGSSHGAHHHPYS
ncbi:Reverse transcriptase domain [Trinorchestia longiramus]|nr:Reverse transcriptase domain [Trinorchestia longiramus]